MSSFTHNGIIYEQVIFTPAETIECNPPFIAGRQDSIWISYRKGKRPKTKEEWENAIRIKIQDIPK